MVFDRMNGSAAIGVCGYHTEPTEGRQGGRDVKSGTGVSRGDALLGLQNREKTQARRTREPVLESSFRVESNGADGGALGS